MRDDNAQMEMLLGLYRGMGDGELLQLAAQSDDLTDVARAALAQVMRERSLSVADDAAPEEADDEPEEGDPSRLREGERWVWTFEDAFQAGEAIRLLDDAKIWHRVIDKSSSGDDDGASRTLLGLMVIVEEQDYAAAVELFRRRMGLFPEAEVHGAGGSPLSGMEGTELLSMFEREEALAVADALGRAGISYWWRDGRQETEELPDEGTVAIEVRGRDVGEAQVVAEKRLAEMG
jgi:hypothetical protein